MHQTQKTQLIMSFKDVKNLLSNGILDKITADEDTFNRLHDGTAADLLEFAKANNINLTPEQASAALAQLKSIATASKMVDVAGGGDDNCVSNW
tara:strand:- start:10910 stop:11191 length:282 start_codon:yes stop_codon:yes gene_type:complete